jgi:ATP-dependent phosphofructokinase / diphosphate-dependent phosphofructokinase
MHVGVLTGGGDCPGLNAVIRAVTLALVRECNARVSGIERGFHGMVARRLRPLDATAVAGILDEGGTILGTHNACDPFRWDGADRSPDALAFLRDERIDVLVAIGGDGTMEIAQRFASLGVNVVGVPKTIDNDLFGTERSFGFDSAVSVVADALGRLGTTARSHGRVMILETMGRHAGWIALHGGLAGGADIILLPELPFDVSGVAGVCAERERHGLPTLICIAEGAMPRGGQPVLQPTAAGEPQRLGGVGAWLQQRLQPLLQSEVRTTLLGHLQRGGAPTAFDRVLATRYGCAAAQLVAQGVRGRMVGLAADACTSVPLADVAGRNRRVAADDELLRAARGLGIALGE